jgi:hypothetical protein
MELVSMPTEIHYHIQSFLDHLSLLQISATSKYFRSLCPEAKIKQSLLCFEKCSLVSKTVMTNQSLLPCYTCLKGLHSYDHFPRIKPDFHYEKIKEPEYPMASEDASRRICATCFFATQPQLVSNRGSDPNPECVFLEHRKYGQSVLYHTLILDEDRYWLACFECKQVKRYRGYPNHRHRRYDQALLKGEMCAACYQPVWDEENEQRRERKNARARERYREKKEARKRREAAESGELTDEGAWGGIATADSSARSSLQASDVDTSMGHAPEWSHQGFMAGFDEMVSSRVVLFDQMLFSRDLAFYI